MTLSHHIRPILGPIFGIVGAIAVAALLAAGGALPASAQSSAPAASAAQPAGKRTPLLIEGKTSLYQRILTRPGAMLAAQPGTAGSRALPPMSVLFVYGRQDVGEQVFLEVGADSEGRTIGWIDGKDAVLWRHTLVLAFTNPANRDRVLFFRDRLALLGLLQSDNLLVQTETWRRQIAASTLPPDAPVISIEPETFIDLQKQFYLLPILEANSTVLPSGFRTRTVKIASVTKDAAAQVAAPAQRGNLEDDLARFRSAIVFVIDASSSMQSNIERTREAVDTVYREIEAAKLGDRVRFGMIAYRDDPAKTKGLEYLVRVFADPNKTAGKAAFMEQVSSLRASTVSTRAFAEDAYAGLDQAIRAIDWKGFGGRYIILITDASAREGNSPLASTGMSTDQLRQLAQANNMAIYVMHLKSPEGRHDHQTARAQYERLTQFPGVGALYFPVEGGDPEELKRQVQQLSAQLVGQVRNAGKPPKAEEALPTPAGDRLAEATEAVGRAMRLAYLGSVQGTKAPPMFEAWASDRDFRRPDVAALSVRVLLTKNSAQRPADDIAPRCRCRRARPDRAGRFLQPVAQRRRRHGAGPDAHRPGQNAQSGGCRTDGRVPGRSALPEPHHVDRSRRLGTHGCG